MLTNFLLDVYVKINDKFCDPYVGVFDTIEQAKSACNVNSNCVAVYDSGCDESAQDVHLCTFASTYLASTGGSCLYEKKGKGTIL